jgi:hypothetical protein
MKRKLVLASLGGLLLLAPGCGKKGPLQAPLVLVPQRVETVKAFQRGSRILLAWTFSGKFIDGRPLDGPAEIEIWLQQRADGAAPASSASSAGDFSSRAARLAAVPVVSNVAEGKHAYALIAGAWEKKTYVFALRVKESRKQRLSEFSDEVTVRPGKLPLPPAVVRAEVLADRIDIRWEAPEKNFDGSTPVAVQAFHIYRTDSAGTRKLAAVPFPAAEWADRDFQFGKAYRYFIRSAATTAEPALESDDSPAIDVLPKDVFPPAAPSGLMAASGPDVITLVWDANADKDLGGYRVWRKEEGQADFICLTDKPIVENTHTDKAVEKEKRYTYAITAVDIQGNESPKSAAVSETIKEPRG